MIRSLSIAQDFNARDMNVRRGRDEEVLGDKEVIQAPTFHVSGSLVLGGVPSVVFRNLVWVKTSIGIGQTQSF